MMYRRLVLWAALLFTALTAWADDTAAEYDVDKGSFYTVEVTYQGVLTTGHINSDLAGYELGQHATMSTAKYTIPATRNVIDLRVAVNDAIKVARIDKVTLTKQAPRQKRSKRAVFDIGDSTAANNGAWAYALQRMMGNYPDLQSLCDFYSRGAGGRNLSTYYTQGKLAAVLAEICPDDILILGNMGTNGMGSSFEADFNYYLDAAEALGAKIIINSYTPHGAVSKWANGYNSTTHLFSSCRTDSYETIVRKIADERSKNDGNYIGFLEIGKYADSIFNVFIRDYAANGYADENAAAQAIISCFGDHNHYFQGTLARDLMLNGYGTVLKRGIVPQLTALLKTAAAGVICHPQPVTSSSSAYYDLSGRPVVHPAHGVFIQNGCKVIRK